MCFSINNYVFFYISLRYKGFDEIVEFDYKSISWDMVLICSIKT